MTVLYVLAPIHYTETCHTCNVSTDSYACRMYGMPYREAIRLTSPQAGVGLYTNLGALLMGSGRIADCLTALQTGIDLAHEHHQTDSALVRCSSDCCLLTLVMS